MTLANFTSDANQTIDQELDCSAELTGGIHKHLILLSALNIFLSITAFLGNILILVALHKESSLHPPPKLLFRSLATTDLCAGITVEPLEVTYYMSVVNERWNICRYTFVANVITAYFLCSVSLMTLAAISTDWLLALLLGLRYRQVVTLKRANISVTVQFLGCLCSRISYVPLEKPYVVILWLYSYTSVSSHFGLLLHKDFPDTASSWNSSPRQRSRKTESNKSPEHST